MVLSTARRAIIRTRSPIDWFDPSVCVAVRVLRVSLCQRNHMERPRTAVEDFRVSRPKCPVPSRHPLSVALHKNGAA